MRQQRARRSGLLQLLSIFFFLNALAFSWLPLASDASGIVRYMVLGAWVTCAVYLGEQPRRDWRAGCLLALLCYFAMGALSHPNQLSFAYALLMAGTVVGAAARPHSIEEIGLAYVIGVTPLLVAGLVLAGVTDMAFAERAGSQVLRSVWLHNNVAGMFALPVALLPFLSSNTAFKWRWMAMAVSIVTILWSGSRGAFLALGVAIAWRVLSSRWGLSRLLLMMSIAVTAYAAFVVLGPVQNLSGVDLLRVEGDVTGGRGDLWRKGLEEMAEGKLFGQGLGLAGQRSAAAVYAGELRTTMGGLGFHNSIINAWVETGLLGGLAFFISIVLVLRRALPKRHSYFLVGLLVVGMVESTLGLPGSPHFILFWTLAMLPPDAGGRSASSSVPLQAFTDVASSGEGLRQAGGGARGRVRRHYRGDA